MNAINRAIDRYKQLILDAERAIWKTPETGYREERTSRYLAEQFEALGYQLTYADGIPGFYTRIETGRPGPEVLILGELDSIICPGHPESDKQTGAVHSCGHNAQCAALLGVAAVLTDREVLDSLCGSIRLCAVPAEELLEIEYRTELKRQGKIRYMGGKTEFLYRGYFEGVDMAFMVHTASSFAVNAGSVGCIAKNVIYHGLAAHAGGAPWNGRNALYAATCGINAVNALRETFRERDMIRFHPIITAGGDMVNAIPETVRIETYVRGATFEAIREANRRINRALCGAALSLGADVEIVDLPGYAPLYNDPGMIELAADAAALSMPEVTFARNPVLSTGSTDMGDLCGIMPVVHPYAGGKVGKDHGNDYTIADPCAAAVDSARWQVAMLKLLLSDGAARAKKILADFKPAFEGREAYLAYIDSINRDGCRIRYNEDESEAIVRID